MITADTITDAQIRALQGDAVHALRFAGDRSEVAAICYAALNVDPWINARRPRERPVARARCAEILNAMAK